MRINETYYGLIARLREKAGPGQKVVFIRGIPMLAPKTVTEKLVESLKKWIKKC